MSRSDPMIIVSLTLPEGNLQSRIQGIEDASHLLKTNVSTIAHFGFH